MLIEDLGLEPIMVPIKKVRLQFSAGKWYVEYQRKPRYFFDQWWWFDDSIYSDYKEAKFRADVLIAQGAVVEYQRISREVEIK